MATKEEWDSYAKEILPKLKSMGYLKEQTIEESSTNWLVIIMVGVLIIISYGIVGLAVYDFHNLVGSIDSGDLKPAVDVQVNASFLPEISVSPAEVSVANYINNTINMPDKINVEVKNES